MTTRSDRITPAGCAAPAFVLCIGLFASWHAFGGDIPFAYDHPFRDRLIVEQEPLSAVLADGRCQHAWDVGASRAAQACSWHFDDPLNPGRQACNVIYPELQDGVWNEDEARASHRNGELQWLARRTSACLRRMAPNRIARASQAVPKFGRSTFELTLDIGRPARQ